MKQFAASDVPATIILGDEAGVLDPERARRWIRLMRESAPGRRRWRCTSTTRPRWATLNHIIGVEEGITILHTAVSSMANGPSMPSTEVAVDNMRRLGHEVALDDSRLAEVSDHLGALAIELGHHVGEPVEYSLATIQQQFPGGMTGHAAQPARDLRHGGPAAGGARGGDPRARRDGLPDHGDAVLAARRASRRC